MAKPARPHDIQGWLATMEKTIRDLGHRHDAYTVFHDFIAMSAIAISNALDARQFAPREAEYMRLIKGYTTLEERQQIAALLGMLTMAMEHAGFADILGQLFHRLEIHNTWRGQFFTPYEVSRCMAEMLIHDSAQEIIEQNGFITCAEPAVGSGCMVIALADALHTRGINYQQHLHVVAVDIDIRSVYMAYIQLALYHIPAIVIHGDSLAMTCQSVWYTPAHMLGFWDSKLARRRMQEPAYAERLPEAVLASRARSTQPLIAPTKETPPPLIPTTTHHTRAPTRASRGSQGGHAPTSKHPQPPTKEQRPPLTTPLSNGHTTPIRAPQGSQGDSHAPTPTPSPQPATQLALF